MSSPFDTHGRIKCGTVVAPDFEATLADYTRLLDLTVADAGVVADDLAASWGTPASAGKRTALLTSATGSPGFLRLVEGSPVPGFAPLRTYGWAAFELTVRDCDALYATIRDDPGFTVIGEPKLVPGFDNFIPFQVTGRGGEVLYLNQVLRADAGGLDLPFAAATVDHMFIAILAAPNRAAAVAAHASGLGFAEGDTYVIPYSVLNASFAMPPETTTAMTMTCVGRMPGSEIDQYPAAATPRAGAPDELPPGNAMISFIVASLDKVTLPFIAPPSIRFGPMYGGRRVASVVGAAGELIELIEA